MFNSWRRQELIACCRQLHLKSPNYWRGPSPLAFQTGSNYWLVGQSTLLDLIPLFKRVLDNPYFYIFSVVQSILGSNKLTNQMTR